MGLGDNVQCSSWAHWKARSRLPVSVNETFFARCYSWGATSEYMFKIGDFAPTGAGWPKISGRRGSLVVLGTGTCTCMQSTGTCIGTWILSTGTGTCNKVLVAKKKIFLCCWVAAGVATSQPKPKKNYGCDWFIYLKCNKSLLPYWVLTNRSDWWCFTTLCVWSSLVLTVRFF